MHTWGADGRVRKSSHRLAWNSAALVGEQFGSVKLNEDLQEWYASDSVYRALHERAWFSGRIAASQAADMGSIPIARSKVFHFKLLTCGQFRYPS